MQLKASGHEVYGFGERKTPGPFVAACTTFLYLDNLEDAVVPTAEDASLRQRSATKATEGETQTKPSTKSLAQDTKLVMILRGAVEATAHEDGWAAMSAVGSAAKRQAPIDPRNYGVKNFPALFAATGLFEIIKGENGQSHVADRRNKDRAPTPIR